MSRSQGVVVGAAVGVVLLLAAVPRLVREEQSSPVADAVIVQHVLIGFRGAEALGRNLPPRARHRDAARAHVVAERVLAEALNQVPFEELVRAHSDDLATAELAPGGPGCADGCGPVGGMPGAYRVSAWPASRMPTNAGEHLHRALAAAATTLAPGELQLFRYDGDSFALGHHIVRRLR